MSTSLRLLPQFWQPRVMPQPPSCSQFYFAAFQQLRPREQQQRQQRVRWNYRSAVVWRHLHSQLALIQHGCTSSFIFNAYFESSSSLQQQHHHHPSALSRLPLHPFPPVRGAAPANYRRVVLRCRGQPPSPGLHIVLQNFKINTPNKLRCIIVQELIANAIEGATSGGFRPFSLFACSITVLLTILVFVLTTCLPPFSLSHVPL